MSKKLDLDAPLAVDHRPLRTGRLIRRLAIEAGDPAEDVIKRHQRKGKTKHDEHDQSQFSEQGGMTDLGHMTSDRISGGVWKL